MESVGGFPAAVDANQTVGSHRAVSANNNSDILLLFRISFLLGQQIE